nr:putative ORF1 [Marmot picobirnavirus]AVX53735.1 putative ORF1 [Marmot picobirnavirus]
MTDIQVRYWQNVETRRHNVSTETQARNELKETKRHNVTGETETKRHNVATERIDSGKLKESTRHNKVTESISRNSLSETKRSNRANEKINRKNANTNAKNASTNARNAATNAKNADTQARKAKADIAKLNEEYRDKKRLNDWYEDNPSVFSAQQWSAISKGGIAGQVVGTLEYLKATAGSKSANTFLQALDTHLTEVYGGASTKGWVNIDSNKEKRWIDEYVDKMRWPTY